MREMERVQHQLHAQLPAFKRKVEQSHRLVEKALATMSKPYVAFSTGKDSLVTYHLVREQLPDVAAVYFDADCAFPESYELLDRYPQVIRWKTEPLLETFARYGGPSVRGVGKATMESTVYAPIRTLLEAHHFDGVFLGLRSQESEGRALSAKYHGTLYQYTRDEVWRCLPVADWSHQDVWAYIVSRDLDYNRVYDKMEDMPIDDRRVSYWAGTTKIRHGRWTFLKQHYPELFMRFAQQFPEAREFV